ncbi:MAG: hypothetical protein COT17_06245 [Elusimicrobia bacterium CG08_land_8_20_14_0_20_51_18]|nr:MAG: hypothetical protein COT17_06245 [Elusimicrobia bacterium CG08_land_8_20_14_0_20_51_18]
MKKIFRAMSLVPSLLIASGMIFASSDGSVMQLSDVDEAIKEIIQEQKDLQVKPLPPGGQPGQNPGHGHPQPHPQPQPPKPQPPQPQPPQPQPPAPVDTTHAYNAGLREGSDKGEREGRHEGHQEGIREGERDGRRNGSNEGETAGRAAGKRDGWSVDQSAGTLRGSNDGQYAGINNGTEAGKKRCYNEGYSAGYNPAFASAKESGLQDTASYNSGYAKGQTDAKVMEAEKGQKAGYQAGFSLRETELENSFPAMDVLKSVLAKSGIRKSAFDFPIELARKGFTTPEEKKAYEKGYREGYQRAYRRAYDDAKRRSYRQSYDTAYRRAYDEQYSISYRIGYAEGREQGYQEAYREAYNSAYSAYFQEYKNREYSDQRTLGTANGRTDGQSEGFAAGCAEQTQRGYKAGYDKTAAEVYPGAFEAGKQSGISAADVYYSQNAVLKVFDAAFYDENTDGKFEASENIMLRAEVRNFGFQKSEDVAIVVKSERGEIVLATDLKAAGVGGRSKSAVNVNIGKLYDVVAPNADALYVTFSVKGRIVGDFRQVYARTNPNKVGVVLKNDTTVKEKATWFFPGKVGKVNSGDKVIITGNKGKYYEVRRSEQGSGSWTKGYISDDELSLQ